MVGAGRADGAAFVVVRGDEPLAGRAAAILDGGGSWGACRAESGALAAGLAVASLAPLSGLALVAVGAALAWGAHCVGRQGRQVMQKTRHRQSEQCEDPCWAGGVCAGVESAAGLSIEAGFSNNAATKRACHTVLSA